MAAPHPGFAHRALVAIVVMLCLAVPALRAQWLNYKVPGVPRTADGRVNLAAPAPRTADDKPDLSGTWNSAQGYFTNLGRDLKQGELVMLPWAEARVKENQSNDHKNDPMVACMPPGVPRIDFTGGGAMLHPFKIVQTPALVVLLYETSTNQTFRQVFMDGRSLPEDMQPTWLGYSIGRWDGDTLVVTTAGFNGRGGLTPERATLKQKRRKSPSALRAKTSGTSISRSRSTILAHIRNRGRPTCQRICSRIRT